MPSNNVVKIFNNVLPKIDGPVQFRRKYMHVYTYLSIYLKSFRWFVLFFWSTKFCSFLNSILLSLDIVMILVGAIFPVSLLEALACLPYSLPVSNLSCEWTESRGRHMIEKSQQHFNGPPSTCSWSQVSRGRQIQLEIRCISYIFYTTWQAANRAGPWLTTPLTPASVKAASARLADQTTDASGSKTAGIQCFTALRYNRTTVAGYLLSST